MSTRSTTGTDDPTAATGDACGCDGCDDGAPVTAPVRPRSIGVRDRPTTPTDNAARPFPSTASSTTFRIDELCCANEERLIRQALAPIEGVGPIEVDLVARRIRVHHDLDDPARIPQAIRTTGMTAVRVADDADAAGAGRIPRRTLITMGLAGVLAVGSEIVAITGAGERSWPVGLMVLGAILLGGLPTLRSGARALVSGKLTISLLMSVAVIGAVIIGQWPEAAVVIWLFGVAEMIEALSLDRARNAIRSLVRLAPETAHLRVGDGWIDTPTESITLGAVVLVRPGERIALDGEVVEGTSTVDQAPITGESVPVAKAAGDQVFAGTINQRGSLQVRVTAPRGEGTLDRIAASIQAAESERAPAQRFVDRFAAVYTPIVFLTAIVVAVLPPLVAGWSWRDWFYRALVLLVLACPCALVISTPVTVVAGLGGAARRGILVKGGVHLENARRIRTVALDKTGTVTVGRPTLVAFVNLTDDRADDELLHIAASIEAHSEHPVAHAIARATTAAPLRATDVATTPGRGITARVDGATYAIGNHAMLEDAGRCSPAVEAHLDRLEAGASTAVVLMDGERPLAVLAVADDLKDSSVAAVDELHGMGVETVMLSGDNHRTVAAIADRVGIDDARGELLPDDKLAAIAELVTRHGPVAMVGDGVNDAPAMARADLAIAMGAAGTDTAIETADVAVMDDDPRRIPEFLRISTHTGHVLWQNIVLAIGIKAVFFALTLAGVVSLWLAVLADMGTSLLVIGNGMRLLRRPSCARGGRRPKR